MATATAEYYDIVVIGKIGMGKSTLGNKLLADGDNRFATDTGNSPYATTTTSELLSNDSTKVRVLDLPGFSDSCHTSQPGQRVSAYEGNLQIVKLIVSEQAANNLQVRRVAYFLPIRGILEKADGSLQEELQVMHHVFGPNIFNCMVVIATNHPRQQQAGYDEEDLERTRTVFRLALQRVINDLNIGFPPVVYIGINDDKEEVLEKIREAPVLQEDEILHKPEHSELEQEHTGPEPEHSGPEPEHSGLEPEHNNFTESELTNLSESPRYVCSYCNVTIECVTDQERNVVVNNDATDDTTEIAYEESKCHPCFKPYSRRDKIFGGIAHILTLGVFLLVGFFWGTTVWPGFTNSEEVCPVCGRLPGTRGCTKVHENTKHGEVDHNYK